ncbi:MAG: hypothetical protein M3O84_08080, partial [Actinomycetota bacterium]|nr:hypothetical protein [Actinomycetota bacterium]
DKLDELAAVLMERETIEKDELVKLLGDMEIRPQRSPERHGAGLAISRRSVRRDPDGPGSLR